MTRVVRRFGVAAVAVVAVALLTGAQRPSLFAGVTGGMWEISGVPGAKAPVRLCVPDPQLLAQFEHRNAACTRVIIRERPVSAELHYTCSGGGFGRSSVSLITARSLRIETQGIAANAPFYYVLQARRVGNCDRH